MFLIFEEGALSSHMFYSNVIFLIWITSTCTYFLQVDLENFDGHISNSNTQFVLFVE